MIAAAGTSLAFATGALHQWRDEKWACRRNGSNCILPKGNGTQHAILIIGNKKSLNLNDLVTGQLPLDKDAGLPTRLVLGALAILWLVLLITASGLTNNSWFLLGVGGSGILHNVIVSGLPRDPSAFGVYLAFDKVIGDTKVMQALYAIESQYPGVGQSMVATFFPGPLNDAEMKKWQEFKLIADRKKS